MIENNKLVNSRTLLVTPARRPLKLSKILVIYACLYYKCTRSRVYDMMQHQTTHLEIREETKYYNKQHYDLN